jgi:galactose mutarotase-like enzyme
LQRTITRSDEADLALRSDGRTTVSLDTVELTHAGVRAEVVPARGAITTALRVDGKELLYLDRATLEDPSKNVRGGVPVLFPFAGKLADETFAPAGTRMKQHGFGRNKPWSVVLRRADHLRLSLIEDADTRAQYPYAYQVEHSVQVLPRGLLITLLVLNIGDRPLPVSPGWHPYFCCPAARKADLRGDVPGLTPGLFRDDREFDFGLPAPANGRARFDVPGLGELCLSFSPEMRHMQFWSQPGRDFVCLEPFWGPNDTVNSDRRLDVAPGEARALWLRIELG